MKAAEIRGKLPSGITKARISSLVQTTLRRARRPKAAAAVSVVGDAAMRKLNRRYRGRNAVTDVLSFAYDKRKPFFPSVEAGDRSLGDIVICLPQIRRQAKRAGRSIKYEFSLMVVHGTLHLMGYDHETKQQEKIMFGLQEQILRAHLKNNFPAG